MRLAVIDYGIGNLRSAQKAFEAIGVAAVLTEDPTTLEAADAVVLPGVGAFGPCVDALEERGLRAVVHRLLDASVPFLGICVGFQLLYGGSAESPGAVGLGVFDGIVQPLPAGEKVPQMQWNELVVESPSPLLDVGGAAPWMYFVHSFAPPVGPETVATCDYGGPVAAMAQRGSVVGMQFHPEKSGPLGLAVLANFVAAAEGRLPWS